MPPSTPILDDFARSDENPIGSGWSSPLIISSDPLGIVSNKLARITLGASPGAYSYFSATRFGPKCEAYATVAVLPAAAGGVVVGLRARNPNTISVNAVFFQYTVGTGWRIFKLTHGGFTQGGSTVASPVLSVNDKIWFRTEGNVYIGSAFTGGAWVEIISWSDPTVGGEFDYSGNDGYLFAAITDATARLDDFGGGTLVAHRRSMTLLGMA